MKTIIEIIRESRNLKIVFILIIIGLMLVMFVLDDSISSNYFIAIKTIGMIVCIFGFIFIFMEYFNIELNIKRKESIKKTVYKDNFLKQLFSRTLITIDSESETKLVQIYEMERNGNFSQMFCSLGNDLNKICFTDDEIKSFCERYPNYLLRKTSFITFFLTKRDDQFFVKVVTSPPKMKYYVEEGKFAEDYVWMAELDHCLVIPDQPETQYEQSADMLKNPLCNFLYQWKKAQ